jgi:hypothetical protein
MYLRTVPGSPRKAASEHQPVATVGEQEICDSGTCRSIDRRRSTPNRPWTSLGLELRRFRSFRVRHDRTDLCVQGALPNPTWQTPLRTSSGSQSRYLSRRRGEGAITTWVASALIRLRGGRSGSRDAAGWSRAVPVRGPLHRLRGVLSTESPGRAQGTQRVHRNPAVEAERRSLFNLRDLLEWVRVEAAESDVGKDSARGRDS